MVGEQGAEKTLEDLMKIEFPENGISRREVLKLLAYVSEKVPGCEFSGRYKKNFKIVNGHVRLQDDEISGTVDVLYNTVLFCLKKGWDEKRDRPRFYRLDLSTPGLDFYEVPKEQKELIESVGAAVNQYFLEKN